MGSSFSRDVDGPAPGSSLADISADAKHTATLLEALRIATERPCLPVLSHSDRLPSGARGISRDFVRGARVFFGEHGSLGKVMGDVCKEAGLETSVCALTRSTGLSLAESIVLCAESRGEVAAALVGEAETFFSYSWTGTKLGDMLGAVDRELERLEALDGKKRYVWVDMFCASQNLLAGHFFASDAEKADLKATAPAGAHPRYLARKEDTDNIFGDALASVKELLLYMSPLTEEWTAPPHSFLFEERGEVPAEWTRSGPGSITRAWCLFEMGKCLQKGCDFHVVLNAKDATALERLLTHRLDDIACIIAGVDARDAQISKTEDRDYIRKEIDVLPGGAGAINAAVCVSLQRWLAEEGQAALARLPKNKRGTSGLIRSLGFLLQDMGDLGGAEALFRQALHANRKKFGNRHRHTLVLIGSLGELLRDKGDLDSAEVLIREEYVGSHERLGAKHPHTLASNCKLGSLLQAKGDLVGAEALFREALEGQREALGDRHSNTLTSINNLGVLLREKGDLDGAKALLREALDTKRATLGERHEETIVAKCSFGGLLRTMGDLGGAELLFLEALNASRETLGNRHRRTLASISIYTDALLARGDVSEARAVMGDAPDAARETLGVDHYRTLVLSAKMACIDMMTCGDVGALRSVVERMGAVLGAQHPKTRKYAAIIASQPCG